MTKAKWPVKVTAGSVTVKIYKTPGNDGSDRFTVCWYEGETRKRLTVQDADGGAFKTAKKEAERIAAHLSTGEAEALKLTGRDRHVYLRAIEALKPLGVSLELAGLEYANARKILGETSIIEAAREFVRRQPQSLPKRSVPDVYDELIAEKTRQGLSKLYLADLRYRCGAFKERFHVPILAVTGSEIRDFLQSLKVSPRSYNNFVAAISTLFTFAQDRGYLPKDFGELDGVGGMKEPAAPIEIFTPDEMARLLSVATEDILPALAIGAFSGLRSAEIERLEWHEVNLAQRFIEITAKKAKTASRRIAPIPDNLAKWLAPYAGKTGKVWPGGHTRFYELQKETAKRTGPDKKSAVKWKHNALRHSWISYRLDVIKNVAQVALEAGNSPSMIFSNYRELVPDKGAAWFDIRPQQAESVVAFRKEQAA